MDYSLCEDFLNANKIMYPLFLHGKDYLGGRADFYPWAVEIHPTAKCNHRCIHCSYKERNENRAEMDGKFFFRLIDDLVRMKVKGVYFSGGGEPCAYPFLAEGIKKLHAAGTEIALISNGSLIEKSGVLDVANLINYIALSVPSCKAEVFQKITGVPNLEVVLGLPEKIKVMHGMQAPIVGARVVVTNLIANEVPLILETLKQRGFDYALFKIVRDYESRGIGISASAEQIIKDEVEILKQNGKINSSFTNLDRIFSYRKPYTPSPVCHTNQMGLLAAVTPEGDVYPNIAEIGERNFWVGNITEKSFAELWNSERHQSVKKYSNRQWGEGKCENCRAISYNVRIEEMLKSVPKEEDPFV